MKRFVNDYSILRAVRTLEGNPIDMDPLALWAIIETRWPGLADHLRSKPETIGLVTDPDAKPPAEPLTEKELEGVPSDLRSLLTDRNLRRLTFFQKECRLTPELIDECCGVTRADTARTHDEGFGSG